jgi:hypothetical protein
MDVNQERQAAGFTSAFNQASNAHASEGLAALGCEDVRGFRICSRWRRESPHRSSFSS